MQIILTRMFSLKHFNWLNLVTADFDFFKMAVFFKQLNQDLLTQTEIFKKYWKKSLIFWRLFYIQRMLS